MIPKGATIDYSDTIECYRVDDGALCVWYRRDTCGPQWPSESYMLIYPWAGE